MPTVLLEAMASGTPCISTAITGVPEVIRHEATGLLVPCQDPIALADALERVLDDEMLALNLSRNARQLIETNFDNRHTSRALRDIFAAAVQTPAATQLTLEPA